MTKDHDFKRLVRERAAQTGKTYMQARDELRPPAERRHDPSSAVPARRRLILVATSHVNVHREPGPTNGDNELAALGIDLSRTRPAEELYIGDDAIFVDVDGRIDVGLTEDFDLVIDAQGSIAVRGICGSVDAATINGHITLDGTIIDPMVDTGDGRITITGAQGTCRATTDNGHISIHGRVTGAFVDTGDGHITIETVECGDIHTGDGHVEVTVGGPGAALVVHADHATGSAVFLGERGDWSARVGHDHSRLLAITASGRVTVHDRTETNLRQ